jgi:acetylornithine/succinyldiaminopimelate/putrescine aminotransferase
VLLCCIQRCCLWPAVGLLLTRWLHLPLVCSLGSSCRFSPPLVLSEVQLHECADIIEKTLLDMDKEIR